MRHHQIGIVQRRQAVLIGLLKMWQQDVAQQELRAPLHGAQQLYVIQLQALDRILRIRAHGAELDTRRRDFLTIHWRCEQHRCDAVLSQAKCNGKERVEIAVTAERRQDYAPFGSHRATVWLCV